MAESLPSGWESKYIGPADIWTQDATVVEVGGQVVEINDDGTNPTVGIAIGNSAIGDSSNYYISGIHTVAVTSAVVIAAGEALYWDVSANEAVDSGGAGAGDPFMGTALTAAGSGVTECVCWLNKEPVADKA